MTDSPRCGTCGQWQIVDLSSIVAGLPPEEHIGRCRSAAAIGCAAERRRDDAPHKAGCHIPVPESTRNYAAYMEHTDQRTVDCHRCHEPVQQTHDGVQSCGHCGAIICIVTESYRAERLLSKCFSSDVESAFAEQWSSEHGLRDGWGSPKDFLAMLLCREPDGRSKHCCDVVTERDRRVAGTLIQWLGTNVGRSFLTESLKRVGAAIIWNWTERHEKETRLRQALRLFAADPHDPSPRPCPTCRGLSIASEMRIGCYARHCKDRLPFERPATP